MKNYEIDRVRRQKAEIRREVKSKGRKISETDRQNCSAKISDFIFSSPIWRKVVQVLVYWPIKHEVDIWPLIARAVRQNKKIAWPRLEQGPAASAPAKISFRYVEQLPERVEENKYWEKGAYGIMQPVGASGLVNLAAGPSMALIPGLAFSPNGARIGRGAGFYDAWLADQNVNEFWKCGMAFNWQIYDTLPTDGHDRFMDIIACDKGLVFAPSNSSSA